MGTFASEVVAIVKAIPAGEVKTYKQVGEEAGSPNAGRVVGAILIPLHIEGRRPVAPSRQGGRNCPGGRDQESCRRADQVDGVDALLLNVECVAFDRSNRVAYLAAASDKAAGRSLKRPDSTPCWKHETVQYSCRDCR